MYQYQIPSQDINKILSQAPSPSFVVHTDRLQKNVKILDQVQQKTGAKILLALKAYGAFSTFPLINKTLKGICASSINEAKLGKEEFGGEVHIFNPAYKDGDIEEASKMADHIVFNSVNQIKRYAPKIKNNSRDISIGIRVNPQHSEVKQDIYNPCASNSRLGVTRENFDPEILQYISGIHFHTLCESDCDALERTIKTVEEKFAEFFPKIKWLNLGGGHHITRKDYDVNKLCQIINKLKEKYNLEIYLEPGEAVALNAGILVTTVSDIIKNNSQIAILDMSASTHVPDIIEMPFRPEIIGAGRPNEKQHTYRLGGQTCLAGDYIGDYSFDKPLEIGQKLALLDMAHYSMVKTTTFNGINLPTICTYSNSQGLKTIREFGYQDYKNRLS